MKISILFSLFLLLAFNANAGEGDAKAGQTKAATCIACHGADGNSMVPMWPKLAGQHSEYLDRQIKLIKSGDRSVPEMAGVVGNLSDQDIADLSAWFNSNTIQLGNADESLLALGESIYRSGDANAGVVACIACHGPTGAGNPIAGYPALGGQHATYTAKVLKDFRAGKGFSSDETGVIMPGVAKQLSDEAIAAVASYIQGLHAAE